jgi:hypothetical protein
MRHPGRGERRAAVPPADPPRVNFDAADRLDDDIERFAGVVHNCAGGIKEPNPDDRDRRRPPMRYVARSKSCMGSA